MLRSKNITGRIYEERIADAITALPLISGEWTNYNPSDPGITVLENLVAFETLQGSYIEEIGNAAKLKLLKLAGFVPKKGKCARLLLSAANLSGPMRLDPGRRFALGDLVFETRRADTVGLYALTGIFSEYGEKKHDYSFLCDRESTIPVKVFGDHPGEGDCIYFFSNGLPDPGEDTCFYISVDSRFGRNAVADRSENLFAALKWEYYTEDGFEEIRVKDYTGAFLFSGELKLRMPEKPAAVFNGDFPVKGYCIRARLIYAHYDICPRFTSVDGFLFEAWQKDSRAICLTFQNTDRIQVKNPLPGAEHILCFAREKKGGSYRRYELCVTRNPKGRFCLYTRGEEGDFTLEFDKDSFGYAPARVKDAVKVVIYSEEIMRQYRVGSVLGYDDQELSLPLGNIVPDTFCLIAKREDQEGGPLFDFVRPARKGDGALTYYLMENDGKIVIEDAGDYIGAELFMGGIAVSDGPRGNIRAGGRLKSPGLAGAYFYNPGPGTGGAFREGLSEVEARFREDLYTPYTCVTARDYERIVAETPGLCIQKVHAVLDELENSVHITVMPRTGEDYPGLSDEYMRAIDRRLSQRRLITTRYKIIPPVYEAVSVHAIIYVKRRFLDCREQIEDAFRSMLDYLKNDRVFGEVLKYEEVFALIESLECVDYIYELYMRPEGHRYTRVKGSDICPVENCLLYPGNIDLEILSTA